MLSKKISKSLYCEYIEEIGFLITYIQDYFYDDEILWPEALELENRLDAYLDALELGGNLALQCMKDLLEGDDDERTGALFSLTSIEKLENGIETARNFFENYEFEDFDDEDLKLCIEAFKHCQSSLFDEKIVRCLDSEKPEIYAAAIEILTYRRGCDPKRIWPFIHNENTRIRDLAVSALARFGNKDAIPAIEQLAANSDDTDKQKILPHLLFLGSKSALDDCRDCCKPNNIKSKELLHYLAMAGDISDFEIINNYINADDMETTAIKAAGILGNVKSVPVLLEKLNSEDLNIADSAGKSLQMITGAGIYESLQIPEEDDDDIKTGSDNNDIEKPVEQIIESGSSPFEKWNTWWTENESQFDPDIRYRYGNSYDHSLLVSTIADKESLLQDRYDSWLELVIRTGNCVHFEPDWFVTKQIPVIQQLS